MIPVIDPRTPVRLRNATPYALRAAFACHGLALWEVCLPPLGEIVAPAFPPDRLALTASATDPGTQVSYLGRLPDLAASCSVRACWRWDQRAGCFSLMPEGDPPVPGLRLRNTLAWPVTIGARFAASPYALRTELAPGASRHFAYQAMDLTVTGHGQGAYCRLAPAARGWAIEAAAGALTIRRLDAGG